MRVVVLGIALLCTGISATNVFNAKAFRSNMANYFMAPNSAESALSFLPYEIEELLPFARGMVKTLSQPLPSSKIDLVCNFCISLVDGALDSVENGATIEDIIENTVDLCLNLNLLTEDDCYGIVRNYVDSVQYMYENDKLSGDRWCGILVGKGCGDWESINDWSINIDQNKPPVEEPVMPPVGSKTSMILQLSDFHLDLTYTLDAQGRDCGGMTCCTNDTAKATPTIAAAGYWGDFNCDTPLRTMTDMLEHIKETHGDDIEYIMMTGDFPAHDVYRQGREDNLAHTQTAVDEIRRIFPDTSVFPSIGNHESFPCNSYPTSEITDPKFEPSWLYQGLANIYSPFLPQSALDTFSVDGYYSVLVSHGLRFIAFNSLYCYAYNFFTNWDTTDPANQLQWLHDELLAAEAAGERVHILGHVPTGHHDFLGGCGREYARIINRFENTVTGQFVGHTHNDEYIVYYEEGTTRATNVAFISPSVTTWDSVNPAYRMYTVDGYYEGSTMRVLDHETYITDITTANAAGQSVRPEYFKLYSAKADLGMANVFPQEWDNLARRMAADDDLYQQFFTYFSSGGESNKDKRSVICNLVTTSNLDDTMCIDVMGEE